MGERHTYGFGTDILSMAGFFHKVAGHVDKLDAEGLRRHYRALTDQLDFFRSVFEALDEGVLAIGEDDTLRYANGAASRLTGMNVDEAEGRPIDKVLPGWDWKELLAPPVTGEGWARSATREFQITYPERRILAVNSMPSERGTVVLMRDVTAEHARENAAIDDERAGAVCELAAGVAHEIGNPLNAISLNLQLLEREFRREPDAKRRERLLADIAVSRSEVKRLDGIIRGFLSAMRPVRPNLVPGTPADALSAALAALRPQLENRGISVTVDLPSAIPPVMVDKEQLQQVFFNLAKNAMEAMKEGGTLAVGVRADDESVESYMLDSGEGMDRESLARLFEPYRTTKDGGNGLGLVICRRIVRAHGGEIDVESKPGAGTRFSVILPRLERRVREIGVSANGQ